MLSKVVLPAPFGPTNATTRPAGTSTLQSRSAHRPPGYWCPSPVRANAAVMPHRRHGPRRTPLRRGRPTPASGSARRSDPPHWVQRRELMKLPAGGPALKPMSWLSSQALSTLHHPQRPHDWDALLQSRRPRGIRASNADPIQCLNGTPSRWSAPARRVDPEGRLGRGIAAAVLRTLAIGLPIDICRE